MSIYHPLLVRSPDLNAWLLSNGEDPFPRNWVEPKKFMGMGGMIRVDGEIFTWLGRPDPPEFGTPMNVTGQTITPTSTIRSYTAKTETVDISMDVTFLSPIEPGDLALQSFPFSYIGVDLKSNSQPHDVQILLDMQGSWLSNQGLDDPQVISNAAANENSIIYLQAAPEKSAAMSATNHRSDDATLYLGMPYESSATFEVGNMTSAREGFKSLGSLTNQAVSGAQPKSTDTYKASLALSKNLGTVNTATTANALFTVGIVRDPSIGYTPSFGASSESRAPCFKSAFGDVGAALAHFIRDFDAARRRASAFDDRVSSPAKAISAEFANLLHLTTRSVMASMDVTCGSGPDDVMFFVDSMGSMHDGHKREDGSRFTNRVDDLYASWPAIMTINATYGRFILEPLLKFQSSGDSLPSYALPDLGKSYPNVDGGTPASGNAVNLGVEESANMLLMIWAQVHFSDETILVDKYYNILTKWAGYLLGPNQIPIPGWTGSADSADGSASDSSNLSLKAILAVRAMSELAYLHGDSGTADDYFERANTFYAEWEKYALTGDHLRWEFNAPDSWGLMYNMYPDKWLGLNLVSDKVYNVQQGWYSNHYNSSPEPDYGLPYNNGQKDVKIHWTSFTAAALESAATRDELMKPIYSYASIPYRTLIFGAKYTLTLDEYHHPYIRDQDGQTSPVLGALYAITARDLEPKRALHYGTNGASEGDGSPSSAPPGSHTGAIAGGVVGGVVLVLLITLLGWFLWRRRRAREWQGQDSIDGEEFKLPGVTVTPFPMGEATRQTSEPLADSSRVPKGRTREVVQNRSETTSDIPGPSIPVSSSSGGTDGQVLTPRIQAEIEGLRRDVQRILTTRYDPPPEY